MLGCALVLAAYPQLTIAQSGAPAGELPTARFPFGVDPAKRCPELRHTTAEAGAVAVVQFLVGTTGAPSKVSIRESSGSEGFDAAATGCVQKLRFTPATRLGDAVPVESWYSLALKSVGPASAPQAARCEQTGQTGEGASSTVVATPQEANDRKQPGPTAARAGVCVCVDESGKLTQPPVLTNSSGIAGFDKAALDLSGAAHYRPAASSSGQPAPGCFRFKVGIDVQ